MTTIGKGFSAAGGALREHAHNSVAKRTKDVVVTRMLFAPGPVTALCLCRAGPIERPLAAT